MKDYSTMSDFDIQQAVLQETWGKHPVRLLGKIMLDIMLSDYDPCNNPADAWPIIYGNGISIGIYGDGDGGRNCKYPSGRVILRSAMMSISCGRRGEMRG